ncbi:protein SINE1 [Humulus lupulus]|uniref:protein SINE1 n=1 Tax=Humulus lupulus TaxID=3486 RepID=UPI002B400F0E|nr:protein SINE1 [Humulus lupulus]XP_062113496.1 protein SINE1 [Humulus lupulus]
MGKSLSPILKRELANLDKDADSRRSAMKALKSYVKDLDSKAIPLFLAQVSQTKEIGLSGECTISLYEVLARVHGAKIVPLIDSIMVTIIKTLTSSAGSFPLQQACSKVVPAIARYGIDPTTPEDKKRLIIHSLCNPLSNALLGSRESLTSGAALCLKALVDSDNWRFASDEMVNKVCQVVAGALEEKSTQTNAHMGLVMTLAKRNATIVEPYARLLLQAGLQILKVGVDEANSQKRLSAIQMVSFLMRWLDPWSICSELGLIIEEMEKCQSDQMAYVRGAAFEALQTARRIAADKGSKFEKSPASVTGSNFSRRDQSRRCLSTSDDQSPTSVSPESQTLDSFVESWVESPSSTIQSSQMSDYDRRSVNRKLWSLENGGVDVSLKDGLFSQIARENSISNTLSEHCTEHGCGNNEDHEEFAGFLQKNSRMGMSRSTTNSPLKSHNSINVDSIIFRTPRKLVQSLQDPDNMNSDYCDKQARRRLRNRSISLSDFDWSPASRYDQNDISQDVNYDRRANGSLFADDEKLQGDSESVSSTDDIVANVGEQESDKLFQDYKTEAQVQAQAETQALAQAQAETQAQAQIQTQPQFSIQKTGPKISLKLVLALPIVFLALFVLLVWIREQQNEFDAHYLVPT